MEEETKNKKQCPVCGKELNEEEKHCDVCGVCVDCS